jgi:hypothetical protein
MLFGRLLKNVLLILAVGLMRSCSRVSVDMDTSDNRFYLLR